MNPRCAILGNPFVIKNLQMLCEQIETPISPHSMDSHPSFALKVPKHFAQQIIKGDPKDPLLRQVLPTLDEHLIAPGFSQDPVGDLAANPTPSLIHKYQGRALLVASPRCDIHCRYCFRRHFPYQQANPKNWQQALATIEQDTSLSEIILSGGDPLTLTQAKLIEIVKTLEAIPHVQTLRIHSRSPIVAPRDFSQLLTHCQASRLNKVLVIHCNHANELSKHTHETLNSFKQAGFHLLNQSVLLKGINDQAATLIALSHALFSQGVLPYYLHQLDKVAGASHFEVSDQQAWLLLAEIRNQLPGYLVPKLVKEVAGAPSKMPLQPA